MVNNFKGPEIVDIGVTCSNGIAVVTVAGELDVSNTTWLNECLQDAIDDGAVEIVLDIEDLTFMDSTGLAVLEGTHERMLADGGTFAIVAPAPNVARLLDLTGLSSLLTIRSTAEGVHLLEPSSQ
jgi:anti-anti-sigma factor